MVSFESYNVTLRILSGCCFPESSIYIYRYGDMILSSHKVNQVVSLHYCF